LMHSTERSHIFNVP